MLDKKINFIFIIFIIFIAQKAYGEEGIYVNRLNVLTNETKAIETFFQLNPFSDRVVWRPSLGKFERFDFIIPKKSFYRSKTFNDSADLYYDSKINDIGARLSKNTFSQFDLTFSEKTRKLFYTTPLTKNYHMGLRLYQKIQLRLGLT